MRDLTHPSCGWFWCVENWRFPIAEGRRQLRARGDLGDAGAPRRVRGRMLSRNLVPWEASRARISGGPRLARNRLDHSDQPHPTSCFSFATFMRSCARIGWDWRCVLSVFRSRRSIHEVSVLALRDRQGPSPTRKGVADASGHCDSGRGRCCRRLRARSGVGVQRRRYSSGNGRRSRLGLRTHRFRRSWRWFGILTDGSFTESMGRRGSELRGGYDRPGKL